MIISREWAMPNANTFSIKPIRRFIDDNRVDGISVDPFANDNRICDITNDIDHQYSTNHHMDALDFLKTFDDESVSFLLFDPPYSPRQVSEVYKSLGMSVNMQTTQSSYWGNLKSEIARIMSVDGRVITFGWNSGGIGQSKNFQIEKILIVAHGGWHNDTICTLERKTFSDKSQMDLFMEITQ